MLEPAQRAGETAETLRRVLAGERAAAGDAVRAARADAERANRAKSEFLSRMATSCAPR